MKELVICFYILILLTQSCNSSNQDVKNSQFKVLRTIQLEENDTSFISGVSNFEIFYNNNVLINSIGNGKVFIYDYNSGNLLRTIKLPLELIDSLRYHFKNYKLYRDKKKHIFSVEELLNLNSNSQNNKEIVFEKIDEYYIRNIQKSIIANDSTIFHIVRIKFLFKENLLDSNKYLQEISMIVKMVNNKIKNCFFPDIIYDVNNDPYFPLYSNFILDNESDNRYYLNVFNEYYNINNSNNNFTKYNYTTTLQSDDYNTKELLALLPEKLIQNNVFYNFSYPQYINLNNKIYYGFQLIDSIYELTNRKSSKLEINSSNEYFFQKYTTDIMDNSNITRIGFVVKSLSKNSRENLCVTTQLFENYEKDSARATHYLFQEYNSKNFNLIKLAKIPYKYKIEDDIVYNTIFIKANPHKENEFVIIYKNKENFYIDFCQW